MPPPSLGYVLKFPLPSLGRLYSVLEGQLNWIDALPKSRSYNFYNLSLFI